MRAARDVGLALLTALGLSCASPVQVTLDVQGDLSACRTWAWHPRTLARVTASHRDAAALDRLVAQAIGEALKKRGFDETRGRASFLVDYDLELVPFVAYVDVHYAPYLLSSYSSSASYWIEGSVREQRDFERIRMVFHARDAGGQVLWRSTLSTSFEDGATIPLLAVVTALFEDFPRREVHPDERRPTPMAPPSLAGSHLLGGAIL